MLYTVYLGGKCFAPDQTETVKLIKVASAFSMKLWAMGFGVFTPAANCLLAPLAHEVLLERILIYNLSMMEHTDLVFMLPNWRDSLEANAERAHALMIKKPVVYSLPAAEKWLQKRSKAE